MIWKSLSYERLKRLATMGIKRADSVIPVVAAAMRAKFQRPKRRLLPAGWDRADSTWVSSIPTCWTMQWSRSGIGRSSSVAAADDSIPLFQSRKGASVMIHGPEDDCNSMSNAIDLEAAQCAVSKLIALAMGDPRLLRSRDTCPIWPPKASDSEGTWLMGVHLWWSLNSWSKSWDSLSPTKLLLLLWSAPLWLVDSDDINNDASGAVKDDKCDWPHWSITPVIFVRPDSRGVIKGSWEQSLSVHVSSPKAAADSLRMESTPVELLKGKFLEDSIRLAANAACLMLCKTSRWGMGKTYYQ